MSAPLTEPRIALTDRLQGAVWGQLVGDAAALGTHWIYDLNERDALFPDGVQGFEAPGENHFHAGKKPGDQTHYGDAALVLLESIAEVGSFDARAFAEALARTFDPQSYPGYLDHATKDMLENFQKNAGSSKSAVFGADDDQLATASRLGSLIVRHQEDPELMQKVEALTRVSQNNDRAVAYAQTVAVILTELLGGHAIVESLSQAESKLSAQKTAAFNEVRGKAEAARGRTALDAVTATQEFGQSCPLEHSFPSALHVLLKHGENFETAILETLRAGGDNAGRAAMLGAWLGAHLGVGEIPKNWRDRLSAHERISRAMDRILASRKS